MAFRTLVQLRERLNLDLGLEADSDDKPWGDIDLRNAAIRDGFQRLWPVMKRMREERHPYVAGGQVITLTDVEDVQLVEVEQSDGIVYSELKNWRNWVVDDDPPVTELRLATGVGQVGATPVVSGYRAFRSDLEEDSDPCDLADNLVWIPLIGARAFLYRRRYHEFMDYEQHANLNRANAIDPPTLYTAYQDAEGAFMRAREENAAEVSLPRRARMSR